MTDEKLEISREKHFDYQGKLYSDLMDIITELLNKIPGHTEEKEVFAKKIEKIIDDHEHNFLVACKREKIIEREDPDRISVDWS